MHQAQTTMPVLLICPGASRGLRLSLFLAAGGLLGAVWTAVLPWEVALVASGLIIAVLAYAWVHKLRVRCVQVFEGRWRVQLVDGAWQDAQLDRDACRLTPGWVHIGFILADGRRVAMACYADAVPADALRQLRLRLRLQREAAQT